MEARRREPIYWTHSTSLEHIVPIAHGGADDQSNFATSCYACNDARVDYLLEELGWELRPVPTEVGWAGSASICRRCDAYRPGSRRTCRSPNVPRSPSLP